MVQCWKRQKHMEGDGMEYQAQYDKTDPKSIEAYSKNMIGKTFREVCEDYGVVSEERAGYGTTKGNKGKLGQLIEEQFFHYTPNSSPEPDFREAGVELKVTPYKINKNGSLAAKERLVLTMIDYCEVVNESFEESHFWNKSKLLLLVWYLYLKELDQLDYRIDYSKLFTPPAQDVKIICHDYAIIVEKIRNGRAHELSESDTLYLSAVTKGATSKDRRKQPFSEIEAKPRAFAFKNSYMTYVLNHYIIPAHEADEAIVQNETVDSFETFVTNKIAQYRDKSVFELCEAFEMDTKKKPKNLMALLTYRMLGIKGNRAEEFEKANVVIKTIRLEKNGRIRENMSFPAFRFKDLVREEWETSNFGTYLRETRFLFVVYQKDKDGVLHLKGSQFWNIPYNDLEREVRAVWEKTRQILRDGIQTAIIGKRKTNNLPKQSENPVCHVRPHAKDASDTYELPDGRQFPKQCFWLNNTYIYSQLAEKLKS